MTDSTRTVVVTGTSSGLGADITRRLVTDGFRVIGISRRAVDPATVGDGYEHVQFDLEQVDQIADLAHTITDRSGPVFGLVNSAAVGRDGVLPTMHNTDIASTIAINLTAPILLTKYLSRGMLDAQEGRIVNVTSIAASTGYRGLAVYSATKAGLEGLTRSLARDLGRRNITVNAVAPGFMETEMTAAMSEGQLEAIMRRSPLGRLPRATSVASIVSFLLGPDGDDVTGTVFTVDAGNSA